MSIKLRLRSRHMGLSFRKSKKFGLLRITFSKRGISTSIGSKYLHVTHSSRGDYLSSSIAGMTMRKKLETSAASDVVPPPEPPSVIASGEENPMHVNHVSVTRKPVTLARLITLIFLYMITLILFSVIGAELPPRDFAVARLLLGVYGIVGAIVVAIAAITFVSQRSKHLDPRS